MNGTVKGLMKNQVRESETESERIKLNQTGSDQIKLNQTGSNRVKRLGGNPGKSG